MARIKPHTLLLQSKKKKAPARVGITTIITCSLVVFLIVSSIVAVYRHWSKRSREREIVSTNSENFGVYEHLKESRTPTYVVLNTSKGLITVEVNETISPDVVKRFLDLCSRGYFNGMLFHRVVQNFLIHGGDPQGLGGVEDWVARMKQDDQQAIRPKHEAFMLGTSRNGKDNSVFDLFITTSPISGVSDKLILFGRVVKGHNVVQEIEDVDTDDHFLPKSPVGILKIALERDVPSVKDQ